ncbi:TPA: phage tail tape measure protein [bacterium]|nr:phage tail tape measure protein [bacterium]
MAEISLGSLAVYLTAKKEDLDRGLEGATDSLRKFSAKTEDFTKKHQVSLRSVGVALTAFGVATTATLGMAVKSYASFETAMVNLRRNTVLSKEETAKLGQEFKRMAMDLPIAANALAGIGAIAADLGVEGVKDIRDFTDLVYRMSVVSEMTYEETATHMKRMATAFDIPITEVEKLASSVVEMGNSVGAAASDIFSAMKKMAPAATALGMTADQAVGLSAAFISMGADARRAGSDMDTVLTAMATNTEKMAEQMGISTTEIKERIEKDVLATLLDYVKALGATPENIEKVSAAQEVFGLTGVRAVSLLMSAYDKELLPVLEAAGKAFEEGTTLQEDFVTETEKLSVSFDKAKTAIGVVATDIGEILAPYIKKALDVFTDFLKKFRVFIGEHPKLTAGTTVLAGILGVLATAFGTLLLLLPKLVVGFKLFVKILAAVGVGVKSICWPILAVEAAILALYLAWKYNLFGIREITREVCDRLIAHFIALKIKIVDIFERWIVPTFDLLKLVWKGVVSDVITTATFLKECFTKVLDWVKGFFAGIGQTIEDLKARLGIFRKSEEAELKKAAESRKNIADYIKRISKEEVNFQIEQLTKLAQIRTLSLKDHEAIQLRLRELFREKKAIASEEILTAEATKEKKKKIQADELTGIKAVSDEAKRQAEDKKRVEKELIDYVTALEKTDFERRLLNLRAEYEEKKKVVGDSANLRTWLAEEEKKIEDERAKLILEVAALERGELTKTATQELAQTQQRIEALRLLWGERAKEVPEYLSLLKDQRDLQEQVGKAEEDWTRRATELKMTSFDKRREALRREYEEEVAKIGKSEEIEKAYLALDAQIEKERQAYIQETENIIRGEKELTRLQERAIIEEKLAEYEREYGARAKEIEDYRRLQEEKNVIDLERKTAEEEIRAYKDEWAMTDYERQVKEIEDLATHYQTMLGLDQQYVEDWKAAKLAQLEATTTLDQQISDVTTVAAKKFTAKWGEAGKTVANITTATANAIGEIYGTAFETIVTGSGDFSKKLEKIWENLKTAVIRYISEMIVKMIALKVLKTALGIPFEEGGEIGPGGKIKPLPTPMQAGGIVTKDIVPAILHPGEVVLPRAKVGEYFGEMAERLFDKLPLSPAVAHPVAAVERPIMVNVTIEGGLIDDPVICDRIYREGIRDAILRDEERMALR